MLRKAVGYCLACILAIFGAPVAFTAPIPTVIASTGGSPPDFSPGFLGLLPHLEVATPFKVPVGSAYTIAELQTPAFHYVGISGSSATFTIHEDAAGVPGAELVSFSTQGISTTERVLSLAPSHTQVVLPGERYWLSGGTFEQQVNWNFPNNVFGTLAVLSRDTGLWRVQQGTGNIPAYAVLGIAVPEPSGAVLFVAGLIPAIVCRGGNGNRRSAFDGEHRFRLS